MELTLEEKYKLIKSDIVKIENKDPIEIFNEIVSKDYINIHGPEHHYLDGASFLIAYRNNGGIININDALDELAKRTVKMPGAMCGYWGVCGSVTSIGACLSIINNTTPITNNNYYKDNMQFTSELLNIMSIIGGPRCCKRNAFLALEQAIYFMKNQYNFEINHNKINCNYSSLNKQCIKERCPYFVNNKI